MEKNVYILDNSPIDIYLKKSKKFVYPILKNTVESKMLPLQTFGFLEDAFVHPSIVNKRNLINGMHLKGSAIKSFNPINKN
jgi:hypothetical protein